MQNVLPETLTVIPVHFNYKYKIMNVMSSLYCRNICYYISFVYLKKKSKTQNTKMPFFCLIQVHNVRPMKYNTLHLYLYYCTVAIFIHILQCIVQINVMEKRVRFLVFIHLYIILCTCFYLVASHGRTDCGRLRLLQRL